ncbi:hypothetical protein SLS58_005942 [Diplodia intermedia]|uniref:Cfem domain protein n=1 Tax=Diplodia intermedia TaxID=856260 RepID=A0ABR3TPP3_9PEZI
MSFITGSGATASSATSVAASTAAAASSTTLATSTRASSGSSAASSSSFSSPSAETVALTTTFTPPPSCTQGRLTLLSSPWYNIWLNEPSPVPGSLVTDCYPSQFISGYTSVFNVTSSIAPLFSPLVCPEAWETVNTFSSSYIACCPSGYALNPPSTILDSRRPAYGGTCYSSVVVGSTYTVTAYNASTLTATQAWPATTSLDQFYAHVIEGYALELKPASTSSASNSSSSSSASPSPTPSDDDSTLSGGAIAGIVIGVLALLALLTGLFSFLLLRRRRRRRQSAAAAAADAARRTSSSPPPTHEVDGTAAFHEKVGDSEFRKELPGSPGAPAGGELESPAAPAAVHELDAGAGGLAEMEGEGVRTRGEKEGGEEGARKVGDDVA